MSTTPFSPYQQFIFKTRYARWVESQNRREEWPEAVARYIDFFKPIMPEVEREKVAAELSEAILSLEVMPSMRAMQTAGKALARDSASNFNCTFIAINDPKVFSEILYLTACTCGVGFSVERQYINEMPVVAETFHPTDTVIKVKDSKIGWASAYRELIMLLYAGSIPSWDVSAVRPKGAKLKTMGGRASGPGPLEELFKHTIRIFKGAAGRKLTSIECHDLVCYISSAIVAGGVRRAATISLSNLSDERMRDAKNGQWWEMNGQRALANNSAVYTERPDIGVFMKEWMSLYASKSGERGIFNRKAAQMQAKKTGRRKSDIDFGVNPCLTIDDWEMTSRGPRRVGDLVACPHIAIVNGMEHKAGGFVYTGVKPVYRLVTKKGFEFKCTKEHEIPIVKDGITVKVQLRDVKTGDTVKLGNNRGLEWGERCIIPDSGGIRNSDGFKFGLEQGKIAAHVDATAEYASSLFARGFLTSFCNVELFRFVSSSADSPEFLDNLAWPEEYGEILRGGSYRLCVLKSLADTKAVQRMLARFGVIVSIKENMYGYGIEVEGDNIAILFKDVLCNPVVRFSTMPAERFTDEIASIEYVGEESVYDQKVDDVHLMDINGILVSNCSEILLRASGQMCNLTEVIIRPDDTKEALKKKVRIATILGTLQSTLTNFRYLRKIWQKNCEEERLLGVSMTGIMDNPLTYKNDDNLKLLLTELKEYAIAVNKEWAEKLGIPQSTSITCCKPSGTVSALCGTSSGIHPAYSRYVLRAVRNDIKDPISSFMQAAGVPCEPDVTKPSDTLVFYFPLKSSPHSVVRSEMTAIDQLELHHTYRNFWAEHSVSNTIYVRDHEWLQVAAWVYEHFDEIGGLSFLPYCDFVYKQAPFQEIDEEEYNKRMEEMPVIDWNRMEEYEKEDNTTSGHEVACSSGVCEL